MLLDRIVVVDDGDLVLAVHRDSDSEPECQEILACSAALTLASPVLKKTLAGTMSEAVAFRKWQEDRFRDPSLEPFRLDIFEDELESAVLFCKAVHHRDVPDRLEVNELLQIAKFCDKYDCSASMRLHAAFWVRNSLLRHNLASRLRDDVAVLCRILAVAFAMRLHREMADVAWALLFNHDGSFLEDESVALKIFSELEPSLPDTVLETLDRKRSQLLGMYRAAALAPLFDWDWNRGKRAQQCQVVDLALGNYLEQLKSLNLAPKERIRYFGDLQTATQLVAVRPMRCKSEWACGCNGGTRDLTTPAKRFVANLPNWKLWYGCIDCMRRAPKQGLVQTCQPQHREFKLKTDLGD